MTIMCFCCLLEAWGFCTFFDLSRLSFWLWAEECQKNCSNCQGAPWLQAEQALPLPLHPGPFPYVTLSLFLHLATGSPTLDSEGWNSGDRGMWMRKRAFLSTSQYSEMCGRGIWEESSDAQLLSSPDEPFLSSLLVNLLPFAQKLFFHCRAMICRTWEL